MKKAGLRRNGLDSIRQTKAAQRCRRYLLKFRVVDLWWSSGAGGGGGWGVGGLGKGGKPIKVGEIMDVLTLTFAFILATV